MDNDGNEVSENDKTRLGMKICTHITHPKLFIAADEVGFNTCQKCDDRKGGARNIYKRGCVPYQQIGKKDNHFTLLGLNNLLG